MDADRSELNDLAGELTELAREMRGKYESWADRLGVVEWGELNLLGTLAVSSPTGCRTLTINGIYQSRQFASGSGILHL